MRRGFSVIELALACLLLAALAALIAPRVLEAQRDARRAEAAIHTDGIQQSVAGYAETTEDHVTLSTGLNPAPSPAAPEVDGTEARVWNQGVTTEGRVGWATLGWQPDGPVRCSYAAEATGKWDRGAWWVLAECDTDGDGQPYQLLRQGPSTQDATRLPARVEPFRKAW